MAPESVQGHSGGTSEPQLYTTMQMVRLEALRGVTITIEPDPHYDDVLLLRAEGVGKSNVRIALDIIEYHFNKMQRDLEKLP